MADPLGGDVFDVENLAEAEIEKLLKQVRNKSYTLCFISSPILDTLWKLSFLLFLSVSRNRSGTIKFY